MPENVDMIALMDEVRAICAGAAEQEAAELQAIRDEIEREAIPETYDPTAHRCALCCPEDPHRTIEVPYWLGDSELTPAHWRFVYHAILDVNRAEPSRQERADAARLYAQVYGNRALARAIAEAKRIPVPHPGTWDPMWDGMLAKLHEAAE